MTLSRKDDCGDSAALRVQGTEAGRRLKTVARQLARPPSGEAPSRNPDPHSELIERAAALKGVADRRVDIVTSDNGMKSAVAVAGVDMILL